MKKITIPDHAMTRMIQRGALREEVEQTIRNGDSDLAERGRLISRMTFQYHSISPVNHKFYEYKTLDVVWADEPLEIVVVTVKVYYHG